MYQWRARLIRIGRRISGGNMSLDDELQNRHESIGGGRQKAQWIC